MAFCTILPVQYLSRETRMSEAFRPELCPRGAWPNTACAPKRQSMRAEVRRRSTHLTQGAWLSGACDRGTSACCDSVGKRFHGKRRRCKSFLEQRLRSAVIRRKLRCVAELRRQCDALRQAALGWRLVASPLQGDPRRRGKVLGRAAPVWRSARQGRASNTRRVAGLRPPGEAPGRAAPASRGAW